MEPDAEIKGFIHGLNSESFQLNKGMVQKSATMRDIPMTKDIYQQTPRPPQPQHQPHPQHVPQPQPAPVPTQHVNTDPALLNNLIERVSSVEKQITRFVSLIEKQVARNAKEINIRIKLDNVSANKE